MNEWIHKALAHTVSHLISIIIPLSESTENFISTPFTDGRKQKFSGTWLQRLYCKSIAEEVFQVVLFQAATFHRKKWWWVMDLVPRSLWTLDEKSETCPLLVLWLWARGLGCAPWHDQSTESEGINVKVCYKMKTVNKLTLLSLIIHHKWCGQKWPFIHSFRRTLFRD